MRVAFCLVGIVGSVQGKYGLDGTTNSTKGLPVDFRIGHHFHKKHIFDHNDVDVFIHSWSDEFKDQLLDLYQPKKYIIQEQIDFKQNTHRMNSICSRWYSTATSVNLKKQYEIENNFVYDMVMLYRFDHIFRTNLIFSEFDPELFYIPHRDDCIGGVCKCETTKRYYDVWFFSKSSNIDKFSGLYENLGKTGFGSPHEDCVRYIDKIGLSDKVKHNFYARRDCDAVRSVFKNCEYRGENNFNLNNLIINNDYPKERF